MPSSECHADAPRLLSQWVAFGCRFAAFAAGFAGYVGILVMKGVGGQAGARAPEFDAVQGPLGRP